MQQHTQESEVLPMEREVDQCPLCDSYAVLETGSFSECHRCGCSWSATSKTE